MKLHSLHESIRISNRFDITEIPEDVPVEDGYREGWRSTTGNGVNPTTGHTATEGDGFYISLGREFAEGMMKVAGFGNRLQRVQFKDNARLINADNLWLLKAWQRGDETIFQPLMKSDDYFLKIIKVGMHKLGIKNKQDLNQNINKLTAKMRELALENNIDGVFASQYAFVVLY
jgi:hypothetical protein